MYSASAESLVMLTHNLPHRSTISFTRNRGSSIAGNRNLLVERFLRAPDLQWLCMIDSDMVVPPDTVQRLLATGKEIVGALSFERNPPYVLGAVRGDDMPDGAPFVLHRVPAVGAGCLLIRRHVLESMPKPWFEHTTPGWNEDFHFCEKATGAGFEVWLDGTLELGHVGATIITKEFVRDWDRTTDGQAHQHRIVLDRQRPLAAR
jgi:hypothetical protein